jgi:hypothetical protein
MVTNVFSCLPWDMKWEISTYLERADGANFNEVLRRDERVYKKFPKDFALKHALRILKQENNSIVRRIQIYIDRDDLRWQRRTAKAMFRFCMNPRSEIAFMYQEGHKDKMYRFFEEWVDEDSECYEGASVVHKERLLKYARHALECVSKTPFIRHISTA